MLRFVPVGALGRLLAVTLPLYFAWEMLQAPFFTGMPARWQAATAIWALATLGDGVLVTLVAAAGALRFRDGRWFGYNRAGAYGHTLGGAVGLAMVEDEDGIPAEAIEGGRFEVDVAGTCYPARASLRPMYDPDRRRILA